MSRLQLGTFSLDLPSGFTLSTVILMGPDGGNGGDGGYSANVVASLEQVPAGASAQDFLEAQRHGLQQAGVPKSSMEAPESVTLEDGHPALLSEQVLPSPQGDRIRQMQLTVVRDEVAHVVVASHLDGGSFERHREAFRKVLLSFA